MSNSDSASIAPGTILGSTFDHGIVAGSYFASLAGCILTIEILHRRGTALGSLRSWCAFRIPVKLVSADNALQGRVYGMRHLHGPCWDLVYAFHWKSSDNHR